MTPNAKSDGPLRAAPVLRWILRRDTSAITCELDACGKGTYELCVLPHWAPSLAVIERFDAPMPAFLRHAEVTNRLRENGWMVIDHVADGRVRAAA